MTLLRKRINDIRNDHDLLATQGQNLQRQIDVIVDFLDGLNLCACEADWTDGTGHCQECGMRRI